MCIAVGQFADYCLETGKGRSITYEEAMEILQRAEDNGYVHQITNIDGEDKIFAICNCALGSCFALRTSQLFNTPNMSASAYRAHVDAEKCVACGKCAEVCPAGAAKLGQKLCTKTGPVVYPQQPLPDDNHWGEHMWSPNYKDDNQKQCHESGTAPCKTACPAHIAVQGYINLAAQGRYLDALKLIKQDNPFPAVCGSICNRRCEDACTRGNVDRAVAIDEIKKFVAEQELQADKRYIPKVITHRGIADPYPEKIAVIGAGPAGLSCAYYLANMGYENVTVFDKNEVPGGMLTLGIPSFRLEKDVVNAEIEVLQEMGVHFQCGVEIGKDHHHRPAARAGLQGLLSGHRRAEERAHRRARAKSSPVCTAAWTSCARSTSARSRASARSAPSSAAATSPWTSAARLSASARRIPTSSTAAARPRCRRTRRKSRKPWKRACSSAS